MMTVLRAIVIAAVIAAIVVSSGKHLRRSGTRGDIETYIHGARLVLSGEDLYRTPEPRGQVSFMYLPLFAIVAIPLTAIPFEAAVVLWCALTIALVLWIVAGFFRAMTGRSFFDVPQETRWIVGGFAILLTLRSLLQHIDLGQANILVMSIAVLGLTMLYTRPLAAGIAIGVSVVLKIIALPLAIVFVVQGRGRVIAGILCGVAAGLALPSVFVGVERNIAYIAYWITNIILSADDLRRTPYWPLEWNYSLAAQIYRFFGGVIAFEHDGRFYSVTLVQLPDAVLRVLAALVPLLVAAVIAAYAWRYRRRDPLIGLWGAVALAFALAPVFSVITLKHYYVMLLPAHVYVVYLWVVVGLRDRWFGGLVVASFVIAMLSTTLFDFLGALLSNLGGLAYGSLLLAAAIFRAAHRISVPARDPRDRRPDPGTVS